MFREYLNEIKTRAKAVHGSKPLWNDKDYLNSNGNIYLSDRNLTELPCIFPEKWEKGFWCNENQLTTLEGAPKEVGGGFWCDNNQLTSLEGAPKKVGGDFGCYHNKLTTLEGAPEKVGGGFYCYGNQLTSLAGVPKEVGRDFWCSNNPTKFTEKQVRDICDVRGGVSV